MKFIEQRLEKLRAVPTVQLRELARLLETRFGGGAAACQAELEHRQENQPGNSAPSFLLLVTGSDASDDLRGLFGVGAILEQSQQGAGMTAAVAAIEEMVLARRVALEEDDQRREILALQLGLAF